MSPAACSSTQRKLDQTFREEVAERCGATTKTARALIGIIFGCIVCDLRTAKRETQELRASTTTGDEREGDVGPTEGPRKKKALSAFGIYTGGPARSSKVAPSHKEETAMPPRLETAGAVSSGSDDLEAPPPCGGGAALGSEESQAINEPTRGGALVDEAPVVDATDEDLLHWGANPPSDDSPAATVVPPAHGEEASSSDSVGADGPSADAFGVIAANPTPGKSALARRYRVAEASADEKDADLSAEQPTAPLAADDAQQALPAATTTSEESPKASEVTDALRASEVEKFDAAAQENLRHLLCCPITQQVGRGEAYRYIPLHTVMYRYIPWSAAATHVAHSSRPGSGRLRTRARFLPSPVHSTPCPARSLLPQPISLGQRNVAISSHFCPPASHPFPSHHLSLISPSSVPNLSPISPSSLPHLSLIAPSSLPHLSLIASTHRVYSSSIHRSPSSRLPHVRPPTCS